MSRDRSFGGAARRGEREQRSGFLGPAQGKHTKRKPSIWGGPVGRQPSLWDWLTGDAKKEAKASGRWGGQHAKGKDDWLRRNLGI
jgi:hypothetical protein